MMNNFLCKKSGQIRANFRRGCGAAVLQGRQWQLRTWFGDGPQPVLHQQEDQVRLGPEPHDVHQAEAARQRYETIRLTQVIFYHL